MGISREIVLFAESISASKVSSRKDCILQIQTRMEPRIPGCVSVTINFASSRVLMWRAAEERGIFRMEAISCKERGVFLSMSRMSSRVAEERAFPIFMIRSRWLGLLRCRQMFLSPIMRTVRFSFRDISDFLSSIVLYSVF